MSVRPTMADLIRRLRTLVADPAGINQKWTDQELQDFFDTDQRRADANYFELTPSGNFASGVTIDHLIFTAPCGDWEASTTIYNSSRTLLTPTESDYVAGRFIFTTDQPPPLYIVGRCFDLFGVAADVLEARAARLAEDYDFKEDTQEFKRSQRVQSLLATAAKFRARSQNWRGAIVGTPGRGDVAIGFLSNSDCDPAADLRPRYPWYRRF